MGLVFFKLVLQIVLSLLVILPVIPMAVRQIKVAVEVQFVELLFSSAFRGYRVEED